MQIIIEEETGGKPLFSADMLSQLIRFYGGTMQGVFARYLEDSLNIFASQQNDAKADFIKNPHPIRLGLTWSTLPSEDRMSIMGITC